ncbi:hypothetical protein [Lagierella sp.]|uniref:hypothetical protein n=1 Tax=Lagierella sp. TaxID=2849657 RepID=UPI0026191DE3|nr:hypothetical protein [Lagierella sp.]
MLYTIKIDKYANDRFKVYEDRFENPLIIGEKVGDPGSYFDAFVNETVSRGAEFVFYRADETEILRIKRDFYDEEKKHTYFEKGEETGRVVSKVEEDHIVLDIDYKDIHEHMILNKGSKEFNLPDVGSIRVLKQGFSPFETLEIHLGKSNRLILLLGIAIYIWDVFVKNRTAFVD